MIPSLPFPPPHPFFCRITGIPFSEVRNRILNKEPYKALFSLGDQKYRYQNFKGKLGLEKNGDKLDDGVNKVLGWDNDQDDDAK